jgi:hypothetical protein
MKAPLSFSIFICSFVPFTYGVRSDSSAESVLSPVAVPVALPVALPALVEVGAGAGVFVALADFFFFRGGSLLELSVPESSGLPLHARVFVVRDDLCLPRILPTTLGSPALWLCARLAHL